MSFNEELGRIRARAGKASDLATEEAAKNALVMPLLRTLGFDVFDPEVVIPEFTADVGTKRGEKVDYALRVNGELAILIECKPANVDIGQAHASQLYRYFAVTPARIGIVTNGIDWHFFTDLDKPNIMDAKPFFHFNVLTYIDVDVVQLEKFKASNFNLANILSTASDLKFSSLMTEALKKEFTTPSEELVRLFTRRVYDGQITSAVRERFSEILRSCVQEVIREEVNRRLLGAIQPPKSLSPATAPADKATAVDESVLSPGTGDPNTTDDEEEAFRIIRSIGRQVIAASRITMRDAQSYCAILADDNNRRPIARLYFTGTRLRIGIFNASKVEERLELSSLDDLYNHADKLLVAISQYTDKGN
ncbi:MAG: type I restriction enzyme HsdR N-terminal domain-containing protein [Roseomonas sp.]|nr:type I restriction enzyme HsdR N-terminal domain-containing protein [Roseomonas sp.]